MPSDMHARPPIISIVGKSNSGKTTLIERLIPVLGARGYRIGTIKHSHHDIDLDRPGKDSYRHKSAGAEAVMVAGPGRVALVKDVVDAQLDELVDYFQDLDLVITEGYKRTTKPKIEICRAVRSSAPLCREDPSLVAMVTDLNIEDLAVPAFLPDDIQGLADFIERRFLSRSAAAAGGGPRF
jgi:molybdopterin-guanine dinucleotide biosynthesis protein MobB